jgi:16S rRNA (guanine527-N7)-methyltransferase
VTGGPFPVPPEAGSPSLPPTPDGAREAFGEYLEGLEAYARLLVGPGVERGLLGPREVDRIWERHLLNCAAVAELVPARATVCDLGSGAGLPGLVLALVRPDLRVILLEPLLRRTVFLEECIARLGLQHVSVRRGRAVEQRDMRVDVVTARAVAALDKLVDWALPLLADGGELLAIKGNTAADELAAATPELRRLGIRDSSVVRVGVGLVDPPTTVVRVPRPASGLRRRARPARPRS